MRRIFLSLAAFAALILSAPLAAERAVAMTLPAPAGLANATAGVNLAEQVRYVCRRYCNRRGCWRRCYYTRPHYVYPYYPYYHRPYRRHRHWRYW